MEKEVLKFIVKLKPRTYPNETQLKSGDCEIKETNIKAEEKSFSNFKAKKKRNWTQFN